MIWPDVLRASFWILGLTGLLLTVSVALWESSSLECTLRQILAKRRYRLGIVLSLACCSVGVTLNAQAWWNKTVWAVVAVLSCWEAIVAWRDKATR